MIDKQQKPVCISTVLEQLSSQLLHSTAQAQWQKQTEVSDKADVIGRETIGLVHDF